MAKVQLAPNFQEFRRSNEESPFYKLSLLQSGKTVVKAYVPEKVNFQMSSEYDTPFSQGFMPKSISDVTKAFGATNLVTQGMTAQVWQGSPTVDLTMQLIFYAITDAGTDVIEPIQKLLELTMPGRSDSKISLLTPPGPAISIINYAKSFSGMDDKEVPKGNGIDLSSSYDGIKNNIAARIGAFLYLPTVVIKSVSQTYDMRFDKNGQPMYAEVDVTLSTFLTPVKEDLPTIFPYNGGRGVSRNPQSLLGG